MTLIETFAAFVDRHVRLKLNSGKVSKRSRYLITALVFSTLFLFSMFIEGESEVLFSMFYVVAAVGIAIFFGSGPGRLASFLAALSVDYHYLRPIGSVLNTWEGYAFLFFTLAIIQAALFFISLLRRYAESVEKARRDLEKAVVLKEEILNVVAHDLRQPISAFCLKQQLILMHLENGQVAEALNLVKDGKFSLDRIEHLIQDLLDGTKMENNSLALGTEDCDFADLVQKLVEEFQTHAARKNISLKKSGTVLSRVRLDRYRIGRVISNLFANALKFTPEGGFVEIGIFHTDGALKVTVMDSGPGVIDKNVQNLFQKCWQDRSTAHLGTGLGLYISKGIIEAHGGRIWYEPVSPHGAKFCFSIPSSG